MKGLDAGLAAHLASGATTLATCWRLTRRDGLVLGFTDHDRELVVDGTTCRPQEGLEGSARPERLGPSVETSEVLGVLSDAAISADDIRLGRYDDAEVALYKVNWRDTGQFVVLARYRIGEIRQEDGAFRAELRSLTAPLGETRGRLYQALCDAELGDTRCGVDLTGPGKRAEAVVLGPRDRYRLAVEGIATFAADAFALGRALWTSGRREGLTDRVLHSERLGGVDILSFAAPVGDWVAEGDELTLTVGCDRSFQTCRTRFGNSVNFRGFPHIPGSDFVLRYPKSGQVRDGRALVT